MSWWDRHAWGLESRVGVLPPGMAAVGDGADGMRASRTGSAATTAAPPGSVTFAMNICAIRGLAPAGLEYTYGQGVTGSSKGRLGLAGIQTLKKQ